MELVSGSTNSEIDTQLDHNNNESTILARFKEELTGFLDSKDYRGIGRKVVEYETELISSGPHSAMGRAVIETGIDRVYGDGEEVFVV